MFRSILAAAVLFLATIGSATAGPDRISVLIGSEHFSPGSDFQETNPGLFLTWVEDPVHWGLGIFRNSYDRTAVAATAAFPFYRNGAFEAGLFVGAAYYPDDGRRFRVSAGDVVPIGGLQLRFGYGFLNLMPGDGEEADGLLAFGLTFPIGDR